MSKMLCYIDKGILVVVSASSCLHCLHLISEELCMYYDEIKVTVHKIGVNIL